MRLGLEDARRGRADVPISRSPAATGYHSPYAEGPMGGLQEDDWAAAGCCVARQSRVEVVRAESALIVSTVMLG